MKKITFFFLCVLFAWQNQSLAQAALNTTGNAPHASSMLDITSTSKGLLIPRMTKANREAITGMATGLMVFQTDDFTGFYFYDGADWLRLDQGDSNAYINNAASEVLGLTYIGQSKTDANNSPAFRFKSTKGYFVDINHQHKVGTSWILYSGNDCTGTAYTSPIFYGPGAVFASPADGSLFYINQGDTVETSVPIQSRYMVDSNTCQVFSETGNYYQVRANDISRTNIDLNAAMDYKVAFKLNRGF